MALGKLVSVGNIQFLLQSGTDQTYFRGFYRGSGKTITAVCPGPLYERVRTLAGGRGSGAGEFVDESTRVMRVTGEEVRWIRANWEGP